jgi:hypothetical protein
MSEENTAPEAGQDVGLSYQDIVAAIQIIDVTSQRGAIQGEELIQVGTVRERFVAFLRHAKAEGQYDGDIPSSSMNPPAEEAPAEEAE